MNLENILAWPGKSDRDNSDITLPAAWHMLDVGACAARLLPRHRIMRDLPEPRRQALIFLVILHDLGKFSTGFRNMILKGTSQDYRHWKLSTIMLEDLAPLLESILHASGETLRVLADAVAGHHGGPLDAEDSQAIRRCICDDGMAAARSFLSLVAGLFPEASLEGLSLDEAKRLSWLLSGLTVQSDWLGSNLNWFPLERQHASPESAWEDSLTRAKTAEAEAGLVPSPPKPLMDGSRLCGLSALRPMQSAVETLALPDGPALFLIEDSTGAGKTEAAQILAHRLLAAGRANGLFFALPTMATANAMFDRFANVVPRLFDGAPSFVLAHSRKDLHEDFQDIIGKPVSTSDSLTCSDWLADDRRLALLAEAGVGTIDQALMAVLPTRFNSLRLHGLSDKLVIVDEAHSYDPYMEAQLAAFLRYHAWLGGSAVVMTATLPKAMRRSFVEAFQTGLGLGDRHFRINPPDIASDAYPALSLISQSISTQAVAPAPATCRSVKVERLAGLDSAVSLISKASAEGAACIWVRNAVDGAIAAVEALRAKGVEADLLHARFTMWDRLKTEQQIQQCFGRAGADRQGRVLVATQVVEASLDLDADVMVSDLAPIGSLIQRAGRLWRHMDLRPAPARPVAGPVLHVLAPDPDEVTGNKWVHQVLDSGAFVYGQDELWRTAKALFRAGCITAPEGLRGLIEAVYGDTPEPVPPAIVQDENKTIGEKGTKKSMAQMNVLRVREEFSQIQNLRVFDDEYIPTRLGAPQVTLLLTRRKGGRLVPWAKAAPLSRAMALSEVQLSLNRFDRLPAPPDQQHPDVRAFKQDWPEWKQKQIEVAIVDEDGRVCDGLEYHSQKGLLISTDKEQAI